MVHVRHMPVLAEMSPMTVELAKQNLEVIEADTRRASEDVLRGTGVDWEFVVRSGNPAHELIATADDRSAPAIVVGGRPHRAAVSGLVGSVNAALVHRFHGSVLVIRGDGSERHPVDTALSAQELSAAGGATKQGVPALNSRSRVSRRCEDRRRGVLSSGLDPSEENSMSF